MSGLEATRTASRSPSSGRPVGRRNPKVRDSRRPKIDDDSEKERRKELFEKVAKAVKEDPKNYAEKLAELGFTWFDDEVDEEDEEERVATIRNDNEKYLVAYFEGDTDLSDQILDAFLAEKSSKSPNYPLFRVYFNLVVFV
jgi:hypothetical protein